MRAQKIAFLFAAVSLITCELTAHATHPHAPALLVALWACAAQDM